MNVIVRAASSTVTLRITPGLLAELVAVVEDLDPVAGRDAQHVVLPTEASRRTVGETISTTGIATEPLSRDHLNVAVPGAPPSWISTR